MKFPWSLVSLLIIFSLSFLTCKMGKFPLPRITLKVKAAEALF